MHGLKPCAGCLRTRKFIRDSVGRMIPRRATHIEYTTPMGMVLVSRANKAIVGCEAAYLADGYIHSDASFMLKVEFPSGLGTSLEYTRKRKVFIHQ